MPYAGGDRIYYNDATTPTYKDQDGNAVVAGSILDLEGNDRITKEMPKKLVADTSTFIITKPGFRYPINGYNPAIRGDAETINFKARR